MLIGMTGLALAMIQPAPQQAARPASVAAAQTPIVAEARTFMDAYARELIAGDRAAVAGRYDRSGAHLVIGRGAKYQSHAEISAVYNDQRWSALPRFAWHDLMFIPAGPDSIVVAGRFSVQRDADAEPTFYSYSNLLVRQDGQLRIRMEHETREPARRVRPAASE